VGEIRPGGISVTTGYDGYGRMTGYARTGEASLTLAYNGMDDRVASTRGSETRRFVTAPDGRMLGGYGKADQLQIAIVHRNSQQKYASSTQSSAADLWYFS
jgi:YD repeat-containing protein